MLNTDQQKENKCIVKLKYLRRSFGCVLSPVSGFTALNCIFETDTTGKSDRITINNTIVIIVLIFVYEYHDKNTKPREYEFYERGDDIRRGIFEVSSYIFDCHVLWANKENDCSERKCF
jgi:hypothetical protein